MKYLIVTIVALILTACGSETTVSGGTKNTIDVNYTVSEIGALSDGRQCLRNLIAGFVDDGECKDPSINYDSVSYTIQRLKDARYLTVYPHTTEEIAYLGL